ncbi:MAG: hypothetical protein E7638_04715 [Ruminococcaceae bacterium]|nr:hypothetical protein [Oscillospiraceae bacterium]
MKKIVLLSMNIENFKGLSRLQLVFGGKDCAIYGDNAAGKSSVCDAWHWLLFGKNQEGAAAFDIKPLGSDGQVKDHAAVTSVEAVIAVDDVPCTLRRTYYEKWSQKRGSAEQSFDGNTSDFYVDGVPMKKGEYEAAIRDLVGSEDVFAMVTSLYAFNEGLNMQSRRRVLYEMCGVRGDAELMAESERFLPLLEAIGKHSIEDYLKKLKSERTELNREKLKVPARIDECRKMKDSVKGIDFDGLSRSLASLDEEREQISGELVRLNNDSALVAKEKELEVTESKREALEMRNRMHRKNQEPKRDTAALDAWRMGAAAAERAYEAILKRKKEAEREIGMHTANVAALRQRWTEVRAEVSSEEEKCPTCGRPFDSSALSRAREAFEAEKAAVLARISDEAAEVKERLKGAEKALGALQAELTAAEKALTDIRAAKPAETVQEVIIVDLPEYEAEKAMLWDEADRLRDEIEDIRSGSMRARTLLEERLTEVRREGEQLQRELAKKGICDESEKRIEELTAYDRELALRLGENDRLTFLCEEFTRHKVSLIEEGVNGHFRLARFKLFDVQVNGGLVDCCEATADGVPYGSVNHGMKVNLGIDIIETLSEYYGIRAPLFIDNGESVTKLTPCSSQVIRLCVSEKDKELRIEKEDNKGRRETKNESFTAA